MDDQNKPNTRMLDLVKVGVLAVLGLLLLIGMVRLGREAALEASLPTPAGTSLIPGGQGTSQPGGTPVPLTPGTPAVAPPTISGDGSVTMSGTGIPGSTVEIWANGAPIGEVAVGDSGTWEFAASPPPGDYQVVVVMRDSNGQVIDQSSTIGVTVPQPGATAAPGTGPTASPAGGATAAPGTEATPAPGTETTAAPGTEATTAPGTDSTPAPGETAQPTAPAIGEAVVSDSGEVTITGTGEPGSTVVIYENGEAVTTAVVGEDGSFSTTYQSTSSGELVFDVQPESTPQPTGTSSGGQATSQPGTPTPTPTLVPIPPGGLAYVVQTGDGLMDLARRYYGDPALWVDIFVATNAMAYQDPSFAILTDPNFIVAGWKIFIPEP